MSRLIDADNYCENICKCNREKCDKEKCPIHNAPTVEAVPVVHGEWVPVPSSDMATGKAYECSNCKKMRYGAFLPPFCQMCGADMRKKA